MKKILVSTTSFDAENISELSLLKAKGFKIVLNPHGRRLKEEEVELLLQDQVLGMIAGVEPLSRAVLEKAKSLKVISRCGIGLDSVDLNAASDLGIRVFNTPEAPMVAVAELTIGLILNLLRRISEADRNVRAGEWKPLMGNLFASQTFGAIGYGRIGRRVCQMARAFGAKVIAYDKNETSVEADVKFLPMRTIFQEADVISLHVPYEKETHHLVGDQMLGSMKSNAILINTARGGIIDEEALCRALKDKKIAGAALDVFEKEPYKDCLRAFPQVVLTSHMGSYAKEARIQMERTAAKNLLIGLSQVGLIENTL